MESLALGSYRKPPRLGRELIAVRTDNTWRNKGDMSRLPEGVELIVGPGVQEAYLPGYPARKDSPLLESDFKYVSHFDVATVCYLCISFRNRIKKVINFYFTTPIMSRDFFLLYESVKT